MNISSETYFPERQQEYLDEIMEYMLENAANRKWLQHSGRKEGSTAFVQTSALYATDRNGNTTELACFFENLTQREQRRLRINKNQFELKILRSTEFRSSLQKTINEITIQ